MLWALLPRAFDDGPDGGPLLNPDYVTSAQVVSEEPQTVRYVINDRARWSNGRLIDWTDFAAQAAALDGSRPEFRVTGLAGYRQVERVERGAGDREALVVFREPVAEWQQLFSPLYPAETTRDPAVFDSGWREGPQLTAGPFRVDRIDPVGGSIMLARDPGWWGTSPRLDRVIFVLRPDGGMDALANGELDWLPIGSVDDLARARGLPWVTVRTAPERDRASLSFGGAPGRPLADPAVRRAVAMGIDRRELADRVVGMIAPPVLTGNHLLAVGSPGYRDNSGLLPFDPDRARLELDAAGWRLPADAAAGAVRERDGRQLRLRYPAVADALAPAVVRDQLARIGVAVDVVPVAPERFVADVLMTGDFDLVSSYWTVPSTPLTIAELFFVEPTDDGYLSNNIGRIRIPEIPPAFREALAEPDPVARAAMADAIDRIAWEQAHSLPLWASPGAYAVRADLANWGAKGFGDWDYVRVGYRR